MILPDHRWRLRNLAAMFRTLNWSIPNVGVRTANPNATIPIQEWTTLKCGSLGEGYLKGYCKKGHENENCTSYAERSMDLQPPGLFLHKTGDDGPSQQYAQCKDHKARVGAKQKNHTTSLYDMVLM